MTLFSLSLFAMSLLSASVARWKSPRAKNSQFKVSPSACEGGGLSKPDFLLLLLSYQEKVLGFFFSASPTKQQSKFLGSSSEVTELSDVMSPHPQFLEGFRQCK